MFIEVESNNIIENWIHPNIPLKALHDFYIEEEEEVNLEADVDGDDEY